MRKNDKLSKAIRAGAFGLSLTLTAFVAPASAQNNNNNNNDNTTTTTTRTAVRDTDRREAPREDDRDWGWLGLLGLAGLLGLMPRKRTAVVHETTRDVRDARTTAPGTTDRR